MKSHQYKCNAVDYEDSITETPTNCMYKSMSFRLNTEWFFSTRTMTTSPGSMPGSWSPSPLKVIFCPSLIPLTMWTSRIFRSFIVFLPWQFLQRSLSVKKRRKKKKRKWITDNKLQEIIFCIINWPICTLLLYFDNDSHKGGEIVSTLW